MHDVFISNPAKISCEIYCCIPGGCCVILVDIVASLVDTVDIPGGCCGIPGDDKKSQEHRTRNIFE